MLKIGLIREEGKVPADKRVVFTPQQCLDVMDEFKNVEIIVQPSNDRSYSDSEYKDHGVKVDENIADCDILFGIKEVPTENLIQSKKYLFFSHTIKKQPKNKNLLMAILAKQIQLIDYECLIDKEGHRVIGFGRFAGIVGAYNGIRAYGLKYELYQLKPAWQCRDKMELEEEMKRVKLPNIKIILTGGGRVSNGASEVLGALKIKKVTPYEILNFSFREPVYAQLHSKDYHTPKNGGAWNDEEFYADPSNFDSSFYKFLPVCDILMHATYWDPKAPKLFSSEQMRLPDFRISVIADITCDIDGSIPSTHRASTIQAPVYGYNPVTEEEDVPFSKNTIAVMAVDNLPCELPRDASEAFGKHLLERVLPSLLLDDSNGLIERASIAKDGKLMPRFDYLSDYVKD